MSEYSTRVGSIITRLLGLREALLGKVPIHDAPKSLDVIRTAVLVLEVVSVLPDVQGNNREALCASYALSH